MINGPDISIGIGVNKSFVLEDAGVSYLLDTYPADAAYSVRKLKSDATLSLRVRRSSDNAEQDIGFDGDNLDTSALTTFVGANDGFVTTWYDQSGNGNNSSQATAGNQPQIVSSGSVITNPDNGIVSLQSYAGAIGNASLSYGGGTIAQPYTLISTLRTSTSLGSFRYYLQGLGISHDWRNGQLQTNHGSNLTFVTGVLSASTTYFVWDLANSTSSELTYNDETPVTGDAGSNNIITIQIPRVSSNRAAEYIQEVIFIDGDQSANLSSIKSDVNTYFSIY